MINPTVELLRDRLVSALAPRRIILFGSRARGTAQPDSDYDILVVADTDLPFEDGGVAARRAVRDVRVSKRVIVRLTIIRSASDHPMFRIDPNGVEHISPGQRPGLALFIRPSPERA